SMTNWALAAAANHDSAKQTNIANVFFISHSSLEPTYIEMADATRSTGAWPEIKHQLRLEQARIGRRRQGRRADHRVLDRLLVRGIAVASQNLRRQNPAGGGRPHRHLAQ